MTVNFSARPISQQELDRIFAHMQGLFGLRVSTELAVTPSAGLTVAIAAATAEGVIVNGTTLGAVTATTKTHAAAHATLNRRDYVYIDTAGAIAIKQGANSASASVPGFLPDLAAGEMALAEVYVAAAVTVINSADITDKRFILPAIPAWDHIETQVLTGTAASVTFQSSQLNTYKMFRLHCFIVPTAALSCNIRLNNDSGANYHNQSLQGAAASATAADSNNATSFQAMNSGSVADPGLLIVEIAKELTTTKAALLARSQYNGTNDPSTVMESGIWANVADLISRIDAIASTSTFAAGSRFVLEGCKTT